MLSTAVVPPLGVYVVWHPRFGDGRQLAESLFSELCADVRQTTARHLRIPIRFRTALETDIPAQIDFDRFRRSAVFVLYDAEAAADEDWRNYLDSVASSAPSSAIVVPICFTKPEFLPPQLDQNNAIRVDDTAREGWGPLVRNRVLHALCRFLDPDESKVLVFLSHAKADGRETATAIKKYLDGTAWLDNFFDEADIPDGSRFAEVIMEAADTAPALLAIQTDGYSSREWCRLEVLEAKRCGVPVVVLSAMEKREDRAFPYLGNTPVLRWNGATSLPDIVGTLLRQVLSRRFFSLRIDHIAQLRGESIPECRFEPPELLTALLKSHGDGPVGYVYVYPDPPIGTEELELLNLLDPKHEPVTPTMWWAS